MINDDIRRLSVLFGAGYRLTDRHWSSYYMLLLHMVWKTELDLSVSISWITGRWCLDNCYLFLFISMQRARPIPVIGIPEPVDRGI